MSMLKSLFFEGTRNRDFVVYHFLGTRSSSALTYIDAMECVRGRFVPSGIFSNMSQVSTIVEWPRCFTRDSAHAVCPA